MLDSLNNFPLPRIPSLDERWGKKNKPYYEDRRGGNYHNGEVDGTSKKRIKKNRAKAKRAKLTKKKSRR